jgi:uncharacterized membrane protein
MNDEDTGQTKSEDFCDGMICYVFGVVFPLMYLFGTKRERQTRFLRFHCIQCLILFLFWTPFLLEHQRTWTYLIGSFFGFAAWFVAIVQAKRHKLFRLPLAGWLADRLA